MIVFYYNLVIILFKVSMFVVITFETQMSVMHITVARMYHVQTFNQK